MLDQRKDESIERTFKGVAKHFREVFSELVQNGHGHLVMMKKKVGFVCNFPIFFIRPSRYRRLRVCLASIRIFGVYCL